VLVAAVLAPHERVHVELGHARHSAEDLDDLLVLVGLESRVPRQGEPILGLSADKRYGLLKGFFPDTGRQLAVEEWPTSRALASGKPVLRETIDIERIDGSRMTLLISAIPLPGGRRRAKGSITVVEDISGQREAHRFSEALNIVNQLVHSTRDSDDIMRRTLERGVLALGAKSGSISLRDGNSCVIQRVEGLPEDLLGIRLRCKEADDGVDGEVCVISRPPQVIGPSEEGPVFDPGTRRRHGIHDTVFTTLSPTGSASAYSRSSSADLRSPLRCDSISCGNSVSP
jgi:hypothetical protein